MLRCEEIFYCFGMFPGIFLSWESKLEVFGLRLSPGAASIDSSKELNKDYQGIH